MSAEMVNSVRIMKLETKVGQQRVEGFSEGRNQMRARRVSKMEQFNQNFNRKMRVFFSSVDWVQVNHYMDKMG